MEEGFALSAIKMMLLFTLGSNDKKIYRQKVYIGDDTMHTMKPFVQPGELL